MSSSLIIEVCRVGKITKHPDADRMAVVEIKGWKTCIKRNDDGTTQFEEGELCIFFPPDSVLPPTLSDRLAVTNYLKKLSGNASGGRVVVSRLRGQPSYGFISKLDILPETSIWSEGNDVADILGVTKWQPPMSCTDGDAEVPHPAFHRYYDMENIKNFPNVIPNRESVIITEKIHGKNARVGLIREAHSDGKPQWTWMAGSHDVRRKESVKRKRKITDEKTGEQKIEEYDEKSQFWQVLDKNGSSLREMISAISGEKNNVVVFGEIFGSGVQDMTYGMTAGNWSFRVFDITVNKIYLSVTEKIDWLTKFDVEMVPVLYMGPFSNEEVEKYTSGNNTISEQPGTFKGREGIVITSIAEQTVSTSKRLMERMVFKSINFEYLERKNGTEFH